MVSKPMCMPIATINPATAKPSAPFEPLSSAEVDAKIQTAHDAFHALRRTSFADRAAKMRRAADILEKEKDRWARMMTTGDGQDAEVGGRRSVEVRLGLPLLRRQRREVSGQRRSGDQRGEKLHRVPAAGSGAGGDAVEFSVLAGVSICRAGADGGKYGTAEARLERSAIARSRSKRFCAAPVFRTASF
jgi:acyl-CoA reductase-like NAD-dependent aldehyde dehydrogenase